jgi:hypothetical protein
MPPPLALLVLPLSFRETSDRRFSAERRSGPARGFAADARPQERQGRLTVEKSVGDASPRNGSLSQRGLSLRPEAPSSGTKGQSRGTAERPFIGPLQRYSFLSAVAIAGQKEVLFVIVGGNENNPPR